MHRGARSPRPGPYWRSALSARLTAVVLAGERPGKSPLTTAADVTCKALIPIGGRPMIHRVVEALEATESIGGIVLCGPRREVAESEPALAALLERPNVTWIEPGTSPARSAAAALETLPGDAPILVTTADHALLQAEIVDELVRRADALNVDVALGVARREVVLSAFPELKKTPHHMRDGAWCGCNLFLMKTPQARQAAEFWQRIEALRKRPWRAARLIGWSFLALYLRRAMTLEQAVGHVAQRIGITAQAIELSQPEAAVDVDTIADWRLRVELNSSFRSRTARRWGIW